MKFGQEIRRRRKALGMTIEQLAEKAELTPNYLGTLEVGRRDPSLSTVLAGYVSDKFGSSVAFLGLAGVAALGLAMIWLVMPETRKSPA